MELEPKIDPPTLDDSVTVEGQNPDSLVHTEPAEPWGHGLINSGAGGDDLIPPISGEKLEEISDESQRVNTLELSQTPKEKLNYNLGGLGADFDGDMLVERFRVAVNRGLDFALQEAAKWSHDETDAVLNTLVVKEDFDLLDVIYDLEFEADLMALRTELGVSTKPTRRSVLEEFHLDDLVQSFGEYAKFGRDFVLGLINNWTDNEKNTVLAGVKQSNLELFDLLSAWGFNSS